MIRWSNVRLSVVTCPTSMRSDSTTGAERTPPDSEDRRRGGFSTGVKASTPSVSGCVRSEGSNCEV